MPKVGGRRKKNRTHKVIDDDEAILGNIPKSFIFRRGRINRPLKQILRDYREVMYPNTSMKLKENEKIKIKEYIKSAGVYGISHMIIFTSTEKNNYMKIIKNPEGPTLTFKIIKYSDSLDIINSQRKPKHFSRDFSQPLLILNGFKKAGTEEQEELEDTQDLPSQNNKENKPTPKNYSLVSLMIQSMFPPLNIAKTSVSQLKRVALFDLDKARDVINFRHYHIRTVPANINRNLKKILKMNKVPDLSQYNDISDFFLKNASGYASDSDGDEIPDSKIELTEKNVKNKYSIRLDEIGPRLELKLMKIEEGVMKGNIFFNRIVKKNKDEIVNLSKKVRQKLLEKGLRKKQQQKIVNQKNKEKKQKEQEREARKAEKEERNAAPLENIEEREESEEKETLKSLNKKRKAKKSLEEGENDEDIKVEARKLKKRKNLENITEFD